MSEAVHFDVVIFVKGHFNLVLVSGYFEPSQNVKAGCFLCKPLPPVNPALFLRLNPLLALLPPHSLSFNHKIYDHSKWPIINGPE